MPITRLLRNLGSIVPSQSRLPGCSRDSSNRHLRGLFFEPLEDRRLLAGVELDPSFGNTSTPGYAIRMDHGSGEILLDPADGGILEVNRLEINRYSADGDFQWSVATGYLGGGDFGGAVLDADGRILVVGTIGGRQYAAPGVPLIVPHKYVLAGFLTLDFL